MKRVLALAISVTVFYFSLFSIEAQRGSVIHVVQPGETIGKIAQRYGVSISEIAANNDIADANVVYGWQELNIPTDTIPTGSGSASSSYTAYTAPAAASGQGTYTVQRGDTLFSIARRHGLSAEALMTANGIEDPRFIHSGLVLTLRQQAAPPAPAPAPVVVVADPAPAPIQTSAPVSAPPPNSAREQYVVRRGDSLSEIGESLRMNWVALAEFNGITDPYILHTGMVLQLPTLEELLQYLPDDSNVKRFYLSNHHPGAHIGVGREIVIELNRQSAYAYENGVLKKRALIASGKFGTPTLQGDYSIWLKRRSQTMSGPGYSLDNVEWVMYFYIDYAMHGTWWHANFGTPTSHGCVNMTNEDAKWFYEFADIGTPVHVRN